VLRCHHTYVMQLDCVKYTGEIMIICMDVDGYTRVSVYVRMITVTSSVVLWAVVVLFLFSENIDVPKLGCVGCFQLLVCQIVNWHALACNCKTWPNQNTPVFFGNLLPIGHFLDEVFYGAQYHSAVVRWYCQFFLFFMGKMVICSMYITWKKYHLYNS
jgi:hypothetical protein